MLTLLVPFDSIPCIYFLSLFCHITTLTPLQFPKFSKKLISEACCPLYLLSMWHLVKGQCIGGFGEYFLFVEGR